MHATPTRKWIPAIVACLWVLGAAVLAFPWSQDLADTVSWPLAIWIVGGLALLPGYLAIWLWSGLLTYRPKDLNLDAAAWPPVCVVISAWNEAEALPGTLSSLSNSLYPGPLRILVLDDGSDDKTADRAKKEGAEVYSFPHRGKAETLNQGLRFCQEEFLVFLDADTRVLPESIHRLVARMRQEGPDCAAVAGAVLVRNTHDSIWTRMQQWDYQLGIAAIKRSQALLGATLVAQGSLSLYRRSYLQSWAWEQMAGEDIVISWRLLRDAGIVFEPTAFALTEVPRNFSSFARQRKRWARGMIEGLRTSGREIFRQRSSARHGVFWAALFPWVDSSYAFAFLPGVLLALSGNFLIVGLWTLLLLPLQGVLFGTEALFQRRAFRETGHKPRKNLLGFWLYFFFYQAILSPISLWGYAQEWFKRDQQW